MVVPAACISMQRSPNSSYIQSFWQGWPHRLSSSKNGPQWHSGRPNVAVGSILSDKTFRLQSLAPSIGAEEPKIVFNRILKTIIDCSIPKSWTILSNFIKCVKVSSIFLKSTVKVTKHIDQDLDKFQQWSELTPKNSKPISENWTWFWEPYVIFYG